MRCRLVDGRAQGCGIGSVGVDGERAAAGRFNFRCQRFGGAGRSTVTDGDLGAVTGQAAGRGGADAARTTVGWKRNWVCGCSSPAPAAWR